MSTPDPNKAQVLWNKGQNFFAAFFAELGNARREINDDTAFARWCFDDLRIPMSVINQVADVLNRVDAAKAKAELAAVRLAEHVRLRRERQQREALAAAERKRKEEERAAAAAEKARREELERQREKDAGQKAGKKKRDARYRGKKREAKKAESKAALAAEAIGEASGNVVAFQNPNIVVKDDMELVTRIKAAIARRDLTRVQWIDTSVELAGLLCEARSRYPADQNFNNWLEENGIKINYDDRAALLNLGLDMRAMRIFLQQTDRTSYRYIWQEVKLRIASK